MVSPLDPARLRHGLSPLTTSPLAPHVATQLNSPISAVSMTSQIQSARISGGAIQPYNPQEWASPSVSTPAHSSERSLQLESDMRNDEGRSIPHLSCTSPAEREQATVIPPPPYSPPRTRRPRPVSTAFEHALDRSSPRNAQLPAMNPHTRLPVEPQATQGFPPPPSTTGRGSSRERRFGLPLLGRRRDQEQVSSSPDPQSPILAPRRSMVQSVAYPELERMASPPMATLQIAPPAARRAASTGAIDTPTSAHSRSASQTRWDHAVPIPPPPQGPPPPSASRSHSVQSVDRNAVPIISPPTRRPPPSGVASLGPVPPTPADWVDEDVESRASNRGRLYNPRCDAQVSTDVNPVVEHTLSSPGAAPLNRTGAVRHDKTIIQRRAESRNRNASPQSSIQSVARRNHISDLVVTPAPNDSELVNTASHSRSGSGSRADHCTAGEPSSSSMKCQDSRNSTPRGPVSARLPRLNTATPPFSPHPSKESHLTGMQNSAAPKALPTPPPQAQSASSSRLGDTARIVSTDSSSLSTRASTSQSSHQFCTDTIERFRFFAEKEATAPTDADRVRLFADFIVNESRIRRGRYAVAIGAMGSEIFDLTRDLFRPMAPSDHAAHHTRGPWTPASSAGPAFSSEDELAGGSTQSLSNSAPASANLLTTPSEEWQISNANRAMNYMPSLSPILSMSVSENYENGSSRGRPPSRWWESGSQGEQAQIFERSKRESKYMGVPKNQWAEEEQSMPIQGSGRSGYQQEAPREYPPEKAGWHDGEDRSWTPDPLSKDTATATTTIHEMARPSRERRGSLDVSRLVTLPPPYPRHHPAVNNNHPELAAIRSSVRSLSDLAEVDKVKEKFELATSKRREEFTKAAKEREQSLKANLQKEVIAGNLEYADAAAIESDLVDQERDKKKELEKTEYERFQNEVVLPLNDLLTGRIARATILFDNLLQHLFDNGLADADLPQEEGDDEPELLEKLTLLKWIFEMRETLHRAIYEVLSDRNRRYREVVVTPYKVSGNAEKLRSAEAFFAEDAAKRAHAYSSEVLDRAQGFRNVMEEAVERGVALQLSAFWDIAPALRQLLDGIPDDLSHFSVQIPPAEMDENPSYCDHPLQYLYSLLQHTEKSTYQFIESHTNLLCLLHEVKEAVVNAQARVTETRVEAADGTLLDPLDCEEEAISIRQSESRRLTDDLKEKVRVVQDQWSSALGEGIRSVKERTGAWLIQRGGWDEALEESARLGEI